MGLDDREETVLTPLRVLPATRRCVRSPPGHVVQTFKHTSPRRKQIRAIMSHLKNMYDYRTATGVAAFEDPVHTLRATPSTSVHAVRTSLVKKACFHSPTRTGFERFAPRKIQQGRQLVEHPTRPLLARPPIVPLRWQEPPGVRKKSTPAFIGSSSWWIV